MRPDEEDEELGPEEQPLEGESEGESEPDDSMDGDAESALASAGFGTNEDYVDFGGGEE